jgi:hypothetical protein
MDKITCLCSQCTPNGSVIQSRTFDAHLNKDRKRLSDVQAKIDKDDGSDLDLTYAEFLSSCIRTIESTIFQGRNAGASQYGNGMSS